MDRSPAEQELNRIERELDANDSPGGKPPVKRSSRLNRRSDNKSLDAVLVTALLLFVVSAVLVFADRLSSTQRMQLKAGSIGGAGGLLLGYGVGRLRP